MQSVLFLVVVLASVVAVTQAFTCYECDSCTAGKENSDTCDAGSGSTKSCKTSAVYDTHDKITKLTKSCADDCSASDPAHSHGKDGTFITCCSKDKCNTMTVNSATMRSAMPLLSLATLLAFTWL